ncbi:MAG: hypothetical protein U1E39_08485 [Planctomycetota bacterium]
MDPAPKALRPYILISTAFVVMGAAAGGLLFLMASPPPRPPAPRVVADPSEAETRALPFADGVPPAQREEVEQALRALVDPAAHGSRAPAETLRAVGGPAVPRLLTAMHEIASDPRRPDDRIERLRFVAIEKVLVAIRAELTPFDPPTPKERAPDAAYVRRRARQWFAWWDRAGAAAVR